MLLGCDCIIFTVNGKMKRLVVWLHLSLFAYVPTYSSISLYFTSAHEGTENKHIELSLFVEIETYLTISRSQISNMVCLYQHVKFIPSKHKRHELIKSDLVSQICNGMCLQNHAFQTQNKWTNLSQLYQCMCALTINKQ